MKRVMVAGTGSGCGKTTVTCALMALLTRRRYAVQPFKCGPDYIDPMFHSFITGRESSNLDPFMLPPATLRYLMRKNAADADISIIEGVMGFYDGLGMDTACSSYEVARIVDAPVILVVNARGMSASLQALVRGFQSFRPDSRIAGLILNGIGERTHDFIKKQLESETGVSVLGYLPQLEECALESRHLGLKTAMEIADLKERLSRLADVAEQSLDIGRILEIASSAPFGEAPSPLDGLNCGEGFFRLGVACDAAFCFYYRDALSLLEMLGAEIVRFSPLADGHLPDDIDGLYLGGGYPEIHAERLSKNEEMLREIRSAVLGGMPTIAECGGFMTLGRSIQVDEIRYPMAGVFESEFAMTGRLIRFGYVEMTALQDSLWAPSGWKGRGHEFHYSDSTDNGEGFLIEKKDGRSWRGVHTRLAGRDASTLYAGYPHLHLWSDPRLAANFADACREYRTMRQKRCCGI